MIKFNAMTTAIRIKKPKDGVSKSSTGFPVDDFEDFIAEDILVEWKNKYGVESYQSDSIQAREPASLRLWFIPGVDTTCRVIRLEDKAEFEIINVDDIMQRHQQLELEVKRYISG